MSLYLGEVDSDRELDLCPESKDPDRLAPPLSPRIPINDEYLDIHESNGPHNQDMANVPLSPLRLKATHCLSSLRPPPYITNPDTPHLPFFPPHSLLPFPFSPHETALAGSSVDHCWLFSKNYTSSSDA